jgi:hypothetical protein
MMRVKWNVEFPEGVHNIETPHLTCTPIKRQDDRTADFVCRIVHPDGSVIEEELFGTSQEVNRWMKAAGDRIRCQLEKMGVRFVDRKAATDG